MDVRLRLIESARVDPIGVGEATVPPIMDFIRQLGIDKGDLVRDIKATYKLGIAIGPGPGIGNVPFQAYWLKMLLEGKAERLEEYSIQSVAALRVRSPHGGPSRACTAGGSRWPRAAHPPAAITAPTTSRNTANTRLSAVAEMVCAIRAPTGASTIEASATTAAAGR